MINTLGSCSFSHNCDSESFQQVSIIQALWNSLIHEIHSCLYFFIYNNTSLNPRICIFGNKEFFLIDCDKLESNQFIFCDPEYKLDNFIYWIWDIAFIDFLSELLPAVLIGAAHNTIIQWNPNTSQTAHFYYV